MERREVKRGKGEGESIGDYRMGRNKILEEIRYRKRE